MTLVRFSYKGDTMDLPYLDKIYGSFEGYARRQVTESKWHHSQVLVCVLRYNWT